MIPNIAQSINDIIKGATPEQKVLWQHARMITGENAAIQQLFYCGTLAASEFLTYSANKLYLAIELEFNSGALSANSNTVSQYNAANVIQMITSNNCVFWETTGMTNRFYYNPIELKNQLFSRLTHTNTTYIKFNGFKIIY